MSLIESTSFELTIKKKKATEKQLRNERISRRKRFSQLQSTQNASLSQKLSTKYLLSQVLYPSPYDFQLLNNALETRCLEISYRAAAKTLKELRIELERASLEHEFKMLEFLELEDEFLHCQQNEASVRYYEEAEEKQRLFQSQEAHNMVSGILENLIDDVISDWRIIKLIEKGTDFRKFPIPISFSQESSQSTTVLRGNLLSFIDSLKSINSGFSTIFKATFFNYFLSSLDFSFPPIQEHMFNFQKFHADIPNFMLSDPKVKLVLQSKLIDTRDLILNEFDSFLTTNMAKIQDILTNNFKVFNFALKITNQSIKMIDCVISRFSLDLMSLVQSICSESKISFPQSLFEAKVEKKSTKTDAKSKKNQDKNSVSTIIKVIPLQDNQSVSSFGAIESIDATDYVSGSLKVFNDFITVINNVDAFFNQKMSSIQDQNQSIDKTILDYQKKIEEFSEMTDSKVNTQEEIEKLTVNISSLERIKAEKNRQIKVISSTLPYLRSIIESSQLAVNNVVDINQRELSLLSTFTVELATRVTSSFNHFRSTFLTSLDSFERIYSTFINSETHSNSYFKFKSEETSNEQDENEILISNYLEQDHSFLLTDLKIETNQEKLNGHKIIDNSKYIDDLISLKQSFLIDEKVIDLPFENLTPVNFKKEKPRKGVPGHKL
ncbi:hypothetical protein RCL1_002587 [Eukaryota sp. TZLM3-RCL]